MVDGIGEDWLVALEWSEVADRLDGSDDPGMLLDIIVLETDQTDWQGVPDVIRRRGDWRPRYSEDGDVLPLPADVAVPFARCQTASVIVELQLLAMYVRGYFWGTDEIEFDVDPGQINSPQRFAALTDLMTEFGRATGKPVHVTPESLHDTPLLTYDPASDDVVAP